MEGETGSNPAVRPVGTSGNIPISAIRAGRAGPAASPSIGWRLAPREPLPLDIDPRIVNSPIIST
jgi:hypothetical protein